MTTALFCPPKYTGEFATLHYHEARGWQVTLWSLGRAWRYTPHERIFDAVAEIVNAGFHWANEGMRRTFEEDVIMAGGN